MFQGAVKLQILSVATPPQKAGRFMASLSLKALRRATIRQLPLPVLLVPHPKFNQINAPHALRRLTRCLQAPSYNWYITMGNAEDGVKKSNSPRTSSDSLAGRQIYKLELITVGNICLDS